MRAAVVLVVLCLIGCRAGVRTTAGGAVSAPGAGPGVRRSLVFSDEGGLLTKLGIGSLGVIAATGAIEDAKSETTISRNGSEVVVTREDSARINGQTAKSLQGFVDAGNTYSLPKRHGGMSANLEIAGESLGGDTSGGQFDLGYSFRHIVGGGPGYVGFRGYLGFGYGKFTSHDRVMDRTDRGPPMFADSTYKFVGMPVRFGVFALGDFDKFRQLKGLEVFTKVNLNASASASTYHVGSRLQWFIFYVEAEVGTQGMSEDDRSLGLEVGLGI